MNTKKFFITTPIYYINAEPSIGSACTTVAADVLARFHRLKGEAVFFLTGTDEHGEKVAEVAEKKGLSPQEYCNQIAPKFEAAWKLLDISNDFFIRTTDPRHEKVVSEFLQKIYDSGDIYKGKYEGWYCVGCESFKTETELEDGHCPLHPPEKTVWKSEDNWFFKLSSYVPEIIKLIEEPSTNYVFPEGKKSEIIAKLKAGVRDISVSRESVSWGIPAPWDKSQTIYVWIDALINYYSATQFLEGKADFWPASLHLLGKEILWFHTVIWQAMLLSAKLPVPLKTFTHSFYTIDGQKMSKSLNNTIPPQEMVDTFGSDGSRYLIATSFPAGDDADIGMARFKEKYNADLANNFGNLVSRVSKLAQGLEVKSNKDLGIDKEFEQLLAICRFDEAVKWIFDTYINPANLLLNQKTPWTKPPEDIERQEVLRSCIEKITIASFYLSPFIPNVADKVKYTFEGQVKPLEEGLFPRIK